MMVEGDTRRFKVDEQALRATLASTSLPFIRKDEQGYLFAETAAPPAQRQHDAGDASAEAALAAPSQQQQQQQPGADAGAELQAGQQDSAAEPQPQSQQGGRGKASREGRGEDIRDTPMKPQARPASWG